MTIAVRDAVPADAESVAEIYAHYVVNTAITFDFTPPSAADFAASIAAATASHPWLIAENESVDGYAFASKWRDPRCGYARTAISSIYVRSEKIGRGIGKALMREMLMRLSGRHHSLIVGIALPNPPSIALHEKMGFNKIGHFPQVGEKFGRFIDVAYFQKIL